MKILITGHKGFIGKNLHNYLLKKNYKVDGYEWLENKLPSPERYDKVVHLGAISSTTERNIDKVLKYNLEFSKNLLDLCNETGTTFIYASSASVYGNIQTENHIKKIKENDPKYPLNPYAWSKFLLDKLIINSLKYKINVQGLRLFNVYGQGEEHKGDQQSVFGKFKKQAKDTKKIVLFEKSDSIKRDFVWVGDVCQIIERLFEVDESNIWNVGTGRAESFFDIANEYSKKYQAALEYIPMPKELHGQYQYYTCANIDKLISTIGDFSFKSIYEYIDED